MRLRSSHATIRCFFLMCILFAVIISLLPDVGRAQSPVHKSALDNKTVSLEMQNRSLAQFAALLAKQTGCSVLIDDQPVRKQAELSLDGTATQAFDQVADCFDYQWTLTASGIVVMSKRFRNAQEVPQIDLPELREITREVVAALRASGCDGTQPLTALGRSFLHTVTPAQVALMQKELPIKASDLTPQQQALLQQCLNARAFSASCAAWQHLSAQLDNFKTSALTCRKPKRGVTASGSQIFDASGLEGAQYTRTFLVRDRRGTLLEDDPLSSDIDSRQNSVALTRNVPPQPMDLTTQQPLPRYDDPRLFTQVHLALGETTVAALLAEVSKQSGLLVEASEALKPHKLIVEADRISVKTLLDSLAQLNDWRWQRLSPLQFVLSRPPALEVRQVGDIAAAVRAALPRDVRTYLGIALRDRAGVANANQSLGRRISRGESQTLYEDLKLTEVNTPPLPCSQLTPEQQQRLLRVLAFAAIDSLSDLTGNRWTAYYIAHANSTNTCIGTMPQFRNDDGSPLTGNTAILVSITLDLEPGSGGGLFAFSIGHMEDLTSDANADQNTVK